MLLIIQTGDPVKQASGRFSDWFIESAGIRTNQVMVVDVHQGEVLPKPALARHQFDHVIITGSPSMVTDRDDWLRSTQLWLEQFMKSQKPILGVCYGHQLLADMLGGEVKANPQGRNMGLSQCHLTEPAARDQLFQDNSPAFPTLVSHLQSVTKLPRSATRLAWCELDPNHAFVCDDHIWGVQFHPEWSPAIMQHYLDARHQDLVAEGFDPSQMAKQLINCPESEQLLRQFMGIQTHVPKPCAV